MTTREPGGSPGAEEIRGLLVSGDILRWDSMTEALLHFAARRDHLTRTVWPALDGGRWALSDRFADSPMAYQGYAQALGRETVEALYRLVVGDFAPDLTIIIDVPPRVGLKRVDDRKLDETRYERMKPDFHARLRDAYLDIARREPGRCVVVDGTKPVAAVSAIILATVVDRLGLEQE
jgi:dTMP kinase